MTEEQKHPAEAWVGRVVADKYRTVRVLGLGGHGAVFEAVNTWTERRVALKLLVGAATLHPEISERFFREARASTRVTHPAIVEVLDMGRDPHDGTLFLVQELLDGEDLRDVLRRDRTIDPHVLIELLAPVLDALSTAHLAGVVHRDLKPANIFLARQRDGRIAAKVIDFGVASMNEGAGGAQELTSAGALLGTPDYMAPEQARGERATGQSDVWAMGVVLYEALAGQRPFRAQGAHAMLLKVIADDPPPLTSVAPGVPASLADLVHRALRRDPAERWTSMASLRDALSRWAESNPRAAGANEVTPQTQLAPTFDPGDATPVSLEAPDMGDQTLAVQLPEHAHYAGGDVTDEATRLRSAPVSSPVAAPSMPTAPPVISIAPPAPSRSSSRAPIVAAVAVAASLIGAALYFVRVRASTPTPRAVATVPEIEPPPTPSRPTATAPPPPVAVPAPPQPVAPAPPTTPPPVARDASVIADASAASRIMRAVPRPVVPTRDLPEPQEMRALFQSATPAVRACVGTGGATLLVTSRVLGASGRVTNVQISSPWTNSPIGACVANVIRRLHVAPFRQNGLDFSWPYVIPPGATPAAPTATGTARRAP